MYFSIEDDDLLEIYSGICNKLSNGISVMVLRKNLIAKPM